MKTTNFFFLLKCPKKLYEENGEKWKKVSNLRPSDSSSGVVLSLDCYVHLSCDYGKSSERREREIVDTQNTSEFDLRLFHWKSCEAWIYVDGERVLADATYAHHTVDIPQKHSSNVTQIKCRMLSKRLSWRDSSWRSRNITLHIESNQKLLHLLWLRVNFSTGTAELLTCHRELWIHLWKKIV